MQSIERLEPRIAPATFIVTNLNDAGEGTLRQAIERANALSGADLIIFQKGLTGSIILDGEELEVTDALTIKGPGSDKLAIDAANNSRIFLVTDDNPQLDSPFAISGLALFNGQAPAEESGGAIRILESLKVKNCVFIANDSRQVGGAIQVAQGDGALLNVDIRGSVFIANSADSAGGALFSGADGSVILKNNLFANNTSEDKSGAIAVASASVTPILVENCEFLGNRAEVRAGAGTISGTMIVRNSLVDGNEAGESVGGFDLFGDRIVVEGSKIVRNTSEQEGIGLNVLGFDSFLLRSSSILGNVSTGVFEVGNPLTAGGGLLINFAEDAVARIVGSTIAHNTAFRGGGLFAHGSEGRLEIVGSRITNNHTERDGAGILAEGAIEVLLMRSKVASNHSEIGRGGGLSLATSLAATIVDSMIMRNVAFAGGGISVTGILTLEDSVVSGNFANVRGGILHGEVPVVTNNTRVFGNVSRDRVQIGPVFPGL